MKRDFETQAVDALRATLRQVSAIKLKDIRIESRGPRWGSEILADIDVYGHNRVLVCKVMEDSHPDLVKLDLLDLCSCVKDGDGDMTPMLIAPTLSAEAQALCKESHTGFLDLEGNARLEMNEVFFAKRSMPYRKPVSSALEPLPRRKSVHFAEVA